MSATNWTDESYTLEEYTPPSWANKLKYTPHKRIRLAQVPTPIHKWKLQGLPEGFQVYIKRDDLTGTSLTGNKVRKLELLLADAVEKGCSDVITTGDMQSNHCRTTTIAATRVGLQTHLVIKSKIKDITEVPCSGNIFLSRMCDAHIYLCDAEQPYGEEIKQKIAQVAEGLKAKTGKEPYIIPRGGSCLEAVHAYIDAYEEMITQGILDNVTDIVLPCGSGGSTAGVAIANYLVANKKIRVHGFKIANFDSAYTYGHVDETLEQLGIHEVTAKDILHFHEQYFGEGYSITTREQLEFMRDVSASTSIILDPTYTGKAAYGMVKEIKDNPDTFLGKRLLFIHTGGLIGALHGVMDDAIREPGTTTNRIYI